MWSQLEAVKELIETGLGEKPTVRFIHENPRLIRDEMCEQQRRKAAAYPIPPND